MSTERGHRIGSVSDTAQVEEHDMDAYLSVLCEQDKLYITRGREGNARGVSDPFKSPFT